MAARLNDNLNVNNEEIMIIRTNFICKIVNEQLPEPTIADIQLFAKYKYIYN